jgi:hypothetical protein
VGARKIVQAQRGGRDSPYGGQLVTIDSVRVGLECDGRLRHSQDADFQHDRTKLTALAAAGGASSSSRGGT